MEIKYENGEYKIVGEFDFGFAGKFKNDENGNGNIKLHLEESDFEILKAKPEDSEKVIKKLTKRINKFQKIVRKNNAKLRCLYLYDIFFELLYVDLEKRFWQNCITLKDYKNNEEVQKKADDLICGYLKRSEEAISNVTDKLEQLFDIALRRIIFLPNVEKYVRSNFKFYDFDLFFASIKPKEIIFDSETFGVDLANSVTDMYVDTFGYRFDKNLEKTFWW